MCAKSDKTKEKLMNGAWLIGVLAGIIILISNIIICMFSLNFFGDITTVIIGTIGSIIIAISIFGCCRWENPVGFAGKILRK